MKKLLILIGLPASGKSYYAKQLVEEGWKRVNKDDLRHMIDNYRFSKDNEKLIHSVSIDLIRKLLIKGHDVVVDNTHCDLRSRTCYYQLAENIGDVEVSEDLIAYPLEDCIKRNNERSGKKKVPEHIIRNMAKKLVPASKLTTVYPPKEAKLIPYDDKLPDIIVCDIDGTLADFGEHRGPFELDKVDQDLVRWPTQSLLLYFILNHSASYIFFITGRSDICRDKTIRWLNRYFLPDDEYKLFMRKEGDETKDNILKKQIYEEHIKGKYNVVAWFEDRLRVSEMVHAEGLPLFRVGDPNADF